MVGVRADATRFHVDDRLEPLNSGNTIAGIVSPKGGVTFGPWGRTELYANAGKGFHSNDARGVLTPSPSRSARVTIAVGF